MEPSRSMLLAMVALIAVGAAACGHRLKPPAGRTAVLVFPDRDSLIKLTQMNKDNPDAIAGLGEAATGRPIVGGTHVKVLSHDDRTAEIVVTRGPYQGLHGFVAKLDVD
ncbi:MAG: hypothetical protein IVW54_13480 [Candidatus Binataceae bacterium]|nr:hypothetical protein [Candidatus Binataceae bacterium]